MTKTFEDIPDFLAAAQAAAADVGIINRECVTRTSESFYGAASYADCLHLLLSGWAAGVERLTDTLKTVDVAANVISFLPTHDVHGGTPDVPRFLAGQPDAMIRWDPTPSDGGAKLFSVAMDSGISGIVSHEAIEARGAAVCALIDGLEASGRRVEFLWQCNATTRPGSAQPEDVIEVRLKTYDQPLDLETFAFCLMHPGAVRRLMFALLTQSTASLYPTSTQYKGPDAVDLYMPGLLSSSTWTAERARDWVAEQLTAQGVELTSA